MKYEVVYTEQETVITIDGVKARVSTLPPVSGTAFVLGTLYQGDRGFVPVTIYQFLAIGDADADSLKKLAVFFFASLLDTELYVIEIPRDSALFPQEAYLGTTIMNEPFNLPIVYKGEEVELKARFERWGYTHRMAVLIGETTVTFEPDEEGGYRALGTGGVETGLLQVIAEKLVKLSQVIN